ncbi:YkvI family membrane protein [Orenia marismortui]|uniref:YkvI family membrane protein n=1 Tax=Orenia marismortui TaxID=46469 RepID=UPI00037FA9A9|nr:hypothetical protein [Orenia marismortui]
MNLKNKIDLKDILGRKEEVKNIGQGGNKGDNKVALSTFRIAATYIGTVVGAGFASGQEVLQFFGYYGFGGFIGLLLATLLFVIYGYIILSLGLEYQAKSHLQVIKYAAGKWLGALIDIVITFFLFGALTAMIAGSGAIFEEQFAIPALWGNIIMAVTSLLTTLLGISGVISAISFVVPLLLTGVFAVTIMTILSKLPFEFSALEQVVAGKPPVPNWILSAINYASYNLVIAVAVLAPLGKEVKEKSRLKWGSIFGGVALGIGAMSILFALVLNLPTAAKFEVPMVYVAGSFAPWVQIVYSAILIAEIYTTAVGNLYGFVARLTDPDGSEYKVYVIITSIVALIASQFGFTTLVRILYPAVGYAGFFLLGGLSFGMVKSYIKKA